VLIGKKSLTVFSFLQFVWCHCDYIIQALCGLRVVKRDTLRILAGCCKRRLNQALYISIYLSLSTVFLQCVVVYQGHFLHCAQSLAAQCIVIGPVCLFVGWCICGSVTTITRNCVHRSSPNWVCR